MLVVGQRLGREARAVGEPRNRLDIEPALARQHAEQHRARRVGAHDPGGRGLAAQRVVDEPGDRGAVAGAGEAMRQAPVLQRLRGRTAARLDIGEDLDGGGEARGGGHAGMRISNAKIDPHREQHEHADREDIEARRDMIGGGVDVGVRDARQHEQPRHHDEDEVGVRGEQREDHDHIEQQRDLELAVVAVADLLRAASGQAD